MASPVHLRPLDLTETSMLQSQSWRPELELLALALGGLLLVLLLRLLSRFSALLPMKRKRRELWKRSQPVIGLFVALGYLTFALRLVLRHTQEVQAFALLALALGAAASFWFALRDMVSGVVLKAGRVCRVGDQVRIGDNEGRIDHMGLRSLTIETREGEEAVIPYRHLTREAIFRTPVIEGSVLYVFRVKAPSSLTGADVRRTVTERALCSHWSSVVRPPQVKALGHAEYEITVFALHADYGPEIESLVRSAPLLSGS